MKEGQQENTIEMKVKNVPEKIWLNLGIDVDGQLDAEFEDETDFKDLAEGEITWCVDKQGPYDLQYVFTADRQAETVELENLADSACILIGYYAGHGKDIPGRLIEIRDGLQAMLDKRKETVE